jgi:acetyltransferase-like isoleucine patch superfamily enzyme
MAPSVVRRLGAPLVHFLVNAAGHIPSRHIRTAVLSRYLGALGERCGVQRNVRFLNGRNVYLGNRVVVNWGTVFDGRHYRVSVGDDVSIGPCATILTLGHDPQSTRFDNRGGEVAIGSRAWIAYGAMILPGVTIGEGAVVAAGAVVTRDVEPYTIVAGNPAHAIGNRPRDLEYHLDYSPWLG